MNEISEGDLVRSKSHPNLGRLRVLAVNDDIVTVSLPDGSRDDADIDDLEEA